VSLSAFQVISIAVVIVGLLMLLESIVIIGGKGIDINGELPFMAFGTLFAAGMPVILNLLGPWEKSWYWYIFVGFLMFSGFTAYIRSRGYTIRLFNIPIKTAIGGLEKALKQNGTAYEKESKVINQENVTKYTIGNGKYPIWVTEKKSSLMLDPHIEIIATEALWNKDLQVHMAAFVMTTRSGRPATNFMKSVFKRLSVGGLTLLLGFCLLVFG
jgi:Ca2+/Na+ antiporter